MDLKYFNTMPFQKAIKKFFEERNIPIIDGVGTITLKEEDFKGNHKKPETVIEPNTTMYYVGAIDKKMFLGNSNNLVVDYDLIVVVAVEIDINQNASRTMLGDITKNIHRLFAYFPVVVVFKYNSNFISLATTERLPFVDKSKARKIDKNKAGQRAGKVSILQNINTTNLHTRHRRLLENLSINQLGKASINTFEELYKHLFDVFSASLFGNEFFNKIYKWYFWAVDKSKFEIVDGTSQEETNKKELIQLLSRIVFLCFFKHKTFINKDFFGKKSLRAILKEFAPNMPDYLFFTNEPHSITKNGKIYKLKGLVQILNAYNFTIYGDDPNSYAVAVDPEMLKHIFEDLLKDSDNKGAFFTSKKITHYMYQESLAEYLDAKPQNKEEMETYNMYEIAYKLNGKKKREVIHKGLFLYSTCEKEEARFNKYKEFFGDYLRESKIDLSFTSCVEFSVEITNTDEDKELLKGIVAGTLGTFFQEKTATQPEFKLTPNPNFKRSEKVPTPDVTTRKNTKKIFLSEKDFLLSLEKNAQTKADLKKIYSIDANPKAIKETKTGLVPHSFIYVNWLMGYTYEENKTLIKYKYNVDFEINTIKRIIHNCKILISKNDDTKPTISPKLRETIARARKKQKEKYHEDRRAAGYTTRTNKK